MNMKKANKGTLKINPKMCPLIRLSVLSRKLGKLFKKHFTNLNLTQSQVYILLMLAETGEIAQSAIGKHLELERSTVSRDLVRLIDKGYLNKTAGGVSPTIGLTKEGIKVAGLVTKEWEKGFKDAFDLLGNKGMNAVAELEQKMKV
ncbi:MAG: MarR family transcriptional regulator [Flavobacteriales bacterium]|nr:MarR family transcriptional regulator [Flavobacteriales bacterium]